MDTVEKQFTCDEVKAKFLELTREITEDNKLDLTTEIERAALDSLRLVNLIVRLEKYFHIKFDDENLLVHQYKLVGDICSYLEKKLGCRHLG